MMIPRNDKHVLAKGDRHDQKGRVEKVRVRVRAKVRVTVRVGDRVRVIG